MVKTPKEGKQHKISKKKRDGGKEGRTRSMPPRHNVTKRKTRKNQAERTNNCTERGTLAREKFCTSKQCTIGMNKMTKKKIRRRNNTAKKSRQEYVYIFFKRSGTSKQNKQATVIYGSSNMCIF